MPKGKFEGGELGEGQGADKFQTEEERSAQEAVGETAAEFEPLTFSQAEEIMGDAILGPKEVLAVFGDLPNPVPLITFTKEELRQAKQRGQMLVLFTDQCASRSNESPVAPITLKELDSQFPGAELDLQADRTHTVYSGHSYFLDEPVRLGWRLISTPENLGRSGMQRVRNVLIGVKNLKKELVAPALFRAVEEYEEEVYEKRNASRLTPEEYRALSLLELSAPRAVEVAYLRILLEKLEIENPAFGNIPTATLSLTDNGVFMQVNIGLNNGFISEAMFGNPNLEQFIAFQSSGRDEEP